MPKKYATEMDTVFRMRLQNEQKRLIFAAIPSPSLAAPAPTASEFWREVIVVVSDMLYKVKRGELSRDEFLHLWGSYGEELLALVKPE